MLLTCLCKFLMHQLIFAEDYYYIDLLKGDETGWDDWYRSSRTWTWQTSGNKFPREDANQNWNDPQWDTFVLYIEVKSKMCN